MLAAIPAGAVASAAIATTIAGAGASMAMMAQQADNQKKLNDYNRQVSENNALRAQQEAQASSQDQRRKNSRLLSKMQAIRGARGNIMAGDTTFEDVVNLAGELELEALSIDRLGKLHFDQYQSEARVYEQRNKALNSTLPLALGATALSGVSRSLTIASEAEALRLSTEGTGHDLGKGG